MAQSGGIYTIGGFPVNEPWAMKSLKTKDLEQQKKTAFVSGRLIELFINYKFYLFLKKSRGKKKKIWDCSTFSSGSQCPVRIVVPWPTCIIVVVVFFFNRSAEINK